MMNLAILHWQRADPWVIARVHVVSMEETSRLRCVSEGRGVWQCQTPGTARQGGEGQLAEIPGHFALAVPRVSTSGLIIQHRAPRRRLTTSGCSAKLIVLSGNKAYWRASLGLGGSPLPPNMSLGAFLSPLPPSRYFEAQQAPKCSFFFCYFSSGHSLCLAQDKPQVWRDHVLLPFGQHGAEWMQGPRGLAGQKISNIQDKVITCRALCDV